MDKKDGNISLCETDWETVEKRFEERDKKIAFLIS